MKKIYFELLFLIAMGLLIIASIYFVNHSAADNDRLDQIEVVRPEIPKVNIEYGMIVDSLKHFTGTIKKNEFAADILTRFDVDYAVIDRIAKASADGFSLRKIKQGNTYHLYYTEDSTGKAVSYFVYQLNKIDYITYDIRNKQYVDVFIGEKTVTKKTGWSQGVINSSLWMTLKENGDDPLLALKLSEIYAWTIDFFDIKKGDQYIVKYEELFVDQEKIGLGDIQSAVMIRKDGPYYAFHYNHDTVDDYFDEQGASLRRTFLKAPLRFSRISSGFSNNRFHPVLKIYRAHHGIDYAAPTGTPVHSIGDGVIIKKGYQKKGGGRYLKIKHNSMYTTVYMHFSRFAKGMVVGKRVHQGETIGYVGSSGLATGPHLDFRVYKFGSAVNPLRIESPPANPVDSTMMEHFIQTITPLKGELETQFETKE